jgi:high-affinity iron transporter
VLLGGVLLVMVGEQAQEMQLAHWLPTTEISWLVSFMPDWMGMWFAVFPTVETLAAQFLAALFVVGSFYAARRKPKSTTKEIGRATKPLHPAANLEPIQ